MKTQTEMLVIDPDTGRTTAYPPGSSFKTPEEVEATKQHFSRKNADRDKALKEQQRKYQRNLQIGELGKYVLLRVKRLPKPEDINAADLGRLVYLSTYCDYDNRLMLTEQSVMRKSDLPRILNLSERKTREFIQNMTAQRQLYFKASGMYISPDFLYRGERREQKYTNKMKIYNLTVRSLYQKLKPTRHKYFGLIIQLIPYVNRRYNVLCWNPTEQDIDLIKPLKIKDVCEILHYDPDNYSVLLEALTGLLFDVGEYQQSACSIVNYTSNGVTGYKILFNPRILYVGEDYKEVTALCMFFPQAIKRVRKNL